MSVGTAERRVGGDDGSGDASAWEKWKQQIAGAEGQDAYIVEDVGRTRILAGRTALPGLDPGFRTDRIMPTRPQFRLLRNGGIVEVASVGHATLQQMQRTASSN